MRAIAALAVAGFHFIHFSAENGPMIRNDSLTNYANFAAPGEGLFFIISAFIIPFALDQSGYRVRNYLRYLC